MSEAHPTLDRRESVISFLKLCASGRVDEAYQKYIAASFRHHNAYFPGDAESLKAGMVDAHKQFPNTKIEIQRVIAEGDLVAIHSRVLHAPDQPEIAVVHIFRFAGEKIAELWDVGMEVPKDSPNENGAF